MAASKADISGWFDDAAKEKASFLIIVCDTFDWDDYPVKVMPHQNPIEVKERYEKQPMSRVMEVYDLSLDKDRQLSLSRAMFLPEPPKGNRE